MAASIPGERVPASGIQAKPLVADQHIPDVSDLLEQIEHEHAQGDQGSLSRIPVGARVRIELTSNGGRYFIYRYMDITTGRRKAIYGGKSTALGEERLAKYEQRSKRYKAKG